MYQMYLTLHVQVVFLQDDPANSLVILDGLHSTCGENSSWYPTEVGIVGYLEVFGSCFETSQIYQIYSNMFHLSTGRYI